MKKIKLLLFTLVVCLISIGGASAADNLVCVYGDYTGGYYTFTITKYGNVDAAVYTNENGTETDIYTKYTYDIKLGDNNSCPKEIYFESDEAGSLIVTTTEYGEYSLPYTLGSQSGEHSEINICYNYLEESDCRTSKGIACVWNENENAPNGGYCNVDNLLYVGCGGASDIPEQVPSIISMLVNLLKIATPIILIFISIVTLLKAMAAQKEDEIKKATSSLIKKIIAGALVFFVVAIVQFIVSVVASDEDEYSGFEKCLNCFLNNKCETNTYYKTVVGGEDMCTKLTSGVTTTCEDFLKTDK